MAGELSDNLKFVSSMFIAPFTSIGGKTASDEKSLEIFLNQEILSTLKMI